MGSLRGVFRGNFEPVEEENVLGPVDRRFAISEALGGRSVDSGINDLLDIFCSTRLGRACGRDRSPTVFIREANIISRSLENVPCLPEDSRSGEECLASK